MAIAEILRPLFPEQSTQKSIALDWLTRLQKAGNQKAMAWSNAYVESQFSRCLKGDPPAMRLFLADREHAVALLEVLGVQADTRDEVLAALEAAMRATGEPPPDRLVIDLTRWSGIATAKPLFEALRSPVIDSFPDLRTVLVLTKALHDDLPRSFDDVRSLRVELVEPGEAAAKVLELTSDGALLLSPRRSDHPERWLAIDYEPRTSSLAFEPSDGLARFVREGAIQLPLVEHDLAACVHDLAPKAFDTSSLGPIAARQRMVELRTEALAEKVSRDPTVRHAMATSLGIVATSTAADRASAAARAERRQIEADIAAALSGLGATSPRTTTALELEDLKVRARRRSSAPTVVRVGDEVHYVNPPAAQLGLDHPRVTVHRVAVVEAASSRLRGATASWTIGDLEADPFLHRLIERLDPDGGERLPLLHARAWLLATGGVRARKGEPVEEWRDALAALLPERMPAAMIPDLLT